MSVTLRLFIAIDLPSDVVSELHRIQLPDSSGVRPTKLDQWHLTLHFLGDADVETVAQALKEVNVPSFSFAIEGVGHFVGQELILWAGLRKSPELQSLHKEVGRAISRIGMELEKRPFSPHITLARCRRNLPMELLTRFLAQFARFNVLNIPVTEFGLYSSSPTKSGHLYRCERSFPLIHGDQAVHP